MRISDLIIIEKLAESRKSTIFRAKRDDGTENTIIKLLKSENSSPSKMRGSSFTGRMRPVHFSKWICLPGVYPNEKKIGENEKILNQ